MMIRKSLQVNPELSQMLELADKNIKTGTVTIFHTYHIKSRDKEDIKITQIKLLNEK